MNVTVSTDEQPQAAWRRRYFCQECPRGLQGDGYTLVDFHAHLSSHFNNTLGGVVEDAEGYLTALLQFEHMFLDRSATDYSMPFAGFRDLRWLAFYFRCAMHPKESPEDTEKWLSEHFPLCLTPVADGLCGNPANHAGLHTGEKMEPVLDVLIMKATPCNCNTFHLNCTGTYKDVPVCESCSWPEFLHYAVKCKTGFVRRCES